MKKLRLGFTDTIEPFAEFFIETLGREYEVDRDDANPDYLIFGDRNFGNSNINFNNKNCVKILYTGENQRPWDYSCHHAITFDHYDSAYHYRLPLYVIFDWHNRKKGIANWDNRVLRRNSGKGFIENFNEREFCSFVVKNGGCEMRNNFFHKLSQYKQVASGGPLFNNIGYTLESGAMACHTKLDFLRKYKFNLCFENASHPGYCTEKLYEALIADTIPIYWGSPTAALDFDPRAFLSWHDYQDDEKFIEAIKEVDDSYHGYRHFLYKVGCPMLSPYNTVIDLDRLVYWFSKNVYQGVLN
jgi:alpha(1,3/1,4) fucosyltransferase